MIWSWSFRTLHVCSVTCVVHRSPAIIACCDWGGRCLRAGLRWDEGMKMRERERVTYVIVSLCFVFYSVSAV